MLMEIKNWKLFFNNRENIFDLEKKRQIIHKKEINELNIKIQEITNAREMMKSII